MEKQDQNLKRSVASSCAAHCTCRHDWDRHFKGSADTLGIAGPSVVLAYLFGGLILFIVMTALAEMAIVYPNMNVQNLVHKAFGTQTSFIVGWLYWVNWIVVTVVELLAGGSF